MAHYSPYREVGLSTTATCRPSITKAGTETFITSSIGNQFQVLNTRHLTPTLVSTPLITSSGNDDDITCLVTSSKLSFVASNKVVSVFFRTKCVCNYACNARVRQLLLIGDILLALTSSSSSSFSQTSMVVDSDIGSDSGSDSDSDSSASSDSSPPSMSTLYVFDVKTSDTSTPTSPSNPDSSSNSLVLAKTIKFDFKATQMCHPHTYLNKILISSSNSSGSLFLFNIRSSKLIHKFACLFGSNNSISNSKITSLVQSPIIDTVAVGMTSGLVHLINLKKDKKLFTLTNAGKNKSPFSVTSISFQTTMMGDASPMAVGLSNGSVSVWDLNKKSLLTTITNAHKLGPVVSVDYIANEPLLITSGSDNSIKMWIFDGNDDTGRLLRQRSGHLKPPSTIRYMFSGGDGVLSKSDSTDANTCNILSAGPDRTLRMFSTARSVLDTEYSQGKGKYARRGAMQCNAIIVSNLCFPPPLPPSLQA